MAEVWISVAAGVAGAGLAYAGSERASDAASKSSAEAIAEQRRQFNLVRSDTAGQRFIGNAATDTLARLYGYGPTNFRMGTGSSGGAPLSVGMPSAGKVPGGSLNIGGTLAASGKLGTVGKLLDPIGSLFGNKHGDERRNIKAFMADNPDIVDLGNGMAQLPDGRTFPIDKVQEVAGAYYGARYHPDGDQAGWQQKYDALLTAPQAAASSASATPSGPDMSAFFTSPDYQFRLGETQKAVDRSAAARGSLLSGAAVKAGARYAGNLASGEYSAFIDRLMQQAGLGSTGIAASANAGMNAANNIGNAYLNAGAARGSAYMAGAEGVNNAVQGTTSNLLLQRYLMGNSTRGTYASPGYGVPYPGTLA